MVLGAKQFEQLSMFASAREIHDSYEHMDQFTGKGETVDELYDKKVKDVRTNGWYRGDKELGIDSFEDSVRKEGVAEPVTVGVDLDTGRKQLWDGHHRVATQFMHDADRLVPVKHEGFRQ